MKKVGLILLVLGILVCVSCGKKAEEAVPQEPEAEAEQAPAAQAAQEPDRVTVQHVLISFKGSANDKPEVTRTQEEAEALAKEIFERAKKGEDFDALVMEYTNDSHPGIYSMHNIGVSPDESINEYPRDRMIKAFGDVSFGLAVGEIGMTEYDPVTSVFGWHIIKRLK